jgi:hypothetical protein
MNLIGQSIEPGVAKTLGCGGATTWEEKGTKP